MNNDWARSLEHTMEHSIGVIDTFKNGCRFAHEAMASEDPLDSSRALTLSISSGKRSLRIGCK